MTTERFQGDAVFPLLADPANYRPCPWDLRGEHAMRGYWLGLFRSHIAKLADAAVEEAADRGLDAADARRRADASCSDFLQYLDAITAAPGQYGVLDILEICIARERSLRKSGIVDPYRLVKSRENEVALAVLPRLLRELEATPDRERPARLAEGVFAGNIFDLGATQTADLFKDASVDFHAVRGKLAPRPWLFDDMDRFTARLNENPPHRAACLFVDNAGSDVILGMIPLARELLHRGTHVILTANITPTLNDITHDELTVVIRRIAEWEPVIAGALRSGKLELIHSGNGLPLIDLTRISPGLADAVRTRGVDLVVIEGMGRAVESNIDAPFTCDVMKIAMIKDHGVADALGGKLYDLVLRFEPAR
ncbi:MAG: ARMT1-like domain-containing protein [Planctomycetes bacterium]|nr:ARMT1-like domain-containing protein [Planctomycetota bacterium]